MDDIYRKTTASGDAVIGSPGDAGFGLIKQAFVERSDVNMIEETYRLKSAQRDYQAIRNLLSRR